MEVHTLYYRLYGGPTLFYCLYGGSTLYYRLYGGPNFVTIDCMEVQLCSIDLYGGMEVQLCTIDCMEVQRCTIDLWTSNFALDYMDTILYGSPNFVL